MYFSLRRITHALAIKMGAFQIGIRSLTMYILLLGTIYHRVLGAATLEVESTTEPCWQVEEFVVLTECAQCSAFQMKSLTACRATGFIEKINCSKSNKNNHKSCHSVLMEEHHFLKFEGTVMGLTVLFVLLVISRQRALDRLASEKVRKQIEAI